MSKLSFFSIIILTTMILVSGFSLAEVVNKPVEIDFNNLDSEIESLNKEFQGTVLEGPIGKIFGDEKINIYLKLENGQEQTISLITEDKKVKSISLGENEDPTLTLQTNQAVVKETLSANNPEQALKKAITDKQINYQARGFFNRIKLAILSLFVKFDAEEEKETEIKAEKPKETGKITEPKEEVSPEEKKEEKIEIKNETKTEIKSEPTGPKTHTVEINAAGFNPLELKIKANDKVEWKNVRNGNTLKLAMVLGTQDCSMVKSGMLKTNEKFSWTFTKPMKCTIVDGVTTTQIGKVIVE